ncbi:MAG TPA: DUF1707 domain-containing protein [Streptosporangiaceae bacterium]|nr:DUF1707 domain-containing protein [Streptosporangiaceae bacterium]
MAMNDRIRVSDADRERVTARLRDHYAEGRLTLEELDERVTAALNAKTVGDLRRLMADLPGDAPLAPPGPMARPAAMARPVLVRRGPRILPLLALIMLAAVFLPGGAFVVLAFFQIMLVLLLAAGLTALFAAHRFRRRMRRYWQMGGYQGMGPRHMYRHHFQPGDWPAGN